jgi:hypothetical protein
MKSIRATENSKTQRAVIEDLPVAGSELSDDHLQLASGGMMMASYEAACCTVGNDTDYHRVD